MRPTGKTQREEHAVTGQGRMAFKLKTGRFRLDRYKEEILHLWEQWVTGSPENLWLLKGKHHRLNMKEAPPSAFRREEYYTIHLPHLKFSHFFSSSRWGFSSDTKITCAVPLVPVIFITSLQSLPFVVHSEQRLNINHSQHLKTSHLCNF